MISQLRKISWIKLLFSATFVFGFFYFLGIFFEQSDPKSWFYTSLIIAFVWMFIAIIFSDALGYSKPADKIKSRRDVF